MSFVLLADTVSFSVVVYCCYLIQSTVSQHINALNEVPSCKFLIRSTQNITSIEYKIEETLTKVNI